MACTIDMLQLPAGNVRFYPAIKIMYNFNIDLIKSFFYSFFFSIYIIGEIP